MTQTREGQQQEIIVHKITRVNQQPSYRRYIKGKLLGKGGFARCYQGINMQTQKHYAIKAIDKDSLKKSRAKQKLLSEVKIHKALHHKHIVEFDSVFEDSSNVYIILELCTNKTLSQMVKKRKRLTVQQTRYFLLQLISALEYMHENRVIHRDLKMGNIFLNQNMELKVGDFGLAAKVQFIEEKKRTLCGTPNYIAPQIVEGAGGHSYEVDLWSTGVICYAILFGRPPFQSSQVKMTYKKIKNCQYVFPNTSVPDEAKDFISKILILDPKKRMTLKQMLQHPFLTNQQIPKSLSIEALKSIPHLEIGEVSSMKRIKSYEKLRPQQFVKKITRNPSDVLNSPRNAFNEQNTQRLKGSTITFEQIFKDQLTHIVSYLDYSTKYGLGYITNNGFLGVYFNDSSLLSVDQENKKVYYIQNATQKQMKPQIFEMSEVPNERFSKKKYQLLERYITCLKEQASKEKIVFTEKKDFIYLQQWLKTKHAIMFRLSNKIFQVNFYDKSQILLNTVKKTVLFTRKNGQKILQTLPNALSTTDLELSKRIKYTKQILNSIKKEKIEKVQDIQSN